jgi:CBS-domain-containing membrane protein
MTRATFAVAPEDSPETAAMVMQEHCLPILPVVADRRLVGVVTRADVIDDLPWPPAGVSPVAGDTELVQAMQRRMDAERAALLAMARTIVAGGAVEDHRVVRGEPPRHDL